MGIVHRHKRVTVSGRMVTVRQHTRDTGGSDGDERRPAAEDAAPAPNAAKLPPPEPREDDETWWDDDDQPRTEPWMDTGGDEVTHEGHTFKVNRAPAYRPQGDYDFAKDERRDG